MRYTSEEIIDQDIKLSFAMIKQILKEHGLSLEEYQNEQSNRENNSGKDLLTWLGY